MLLAAVALSEATRSFDKLYHYKISLDEKTKPTPGMRVVIPFGRKNQLRSGWIIEVWDGEHEKKLKEIAQIVDQTPLLSEEMIKLVARWRTLSSVLYSRGNKGASSPMTRATRAVPAKPKKISFQISLRASCTLPAPSCWPMITATVEPVEISTALKRLEMVLEMLVEQVIQIIKMDLELHIYGKKFYVKTLY